MRKAHPPMSATQRLHLAVSDAHVLGLLYLIIGVGLCALEVAISSLGGQVLISATSIVMIAPGIVYLLVARSLQRADAAAATLGLRIAVAHIAAIALLIAIALAIQAAGFLEATALRRQLTPAIVPAVFSIFFVPAKGVFLFHLIRARQAARIMSGPGHAFQVQSVQPIPPPAAQAIRPPANNDRSPA